MYTKKEPKLVLINIENSSEHIAPVLGFCYMAAYLKKMLNYGNIKQLNFLYTDNDIEQKILNEDPDIIGFRTITAHIYLIDKISKVLKERYRLPIIYGGPHITALPKDLPGFVDLAVIGEGEESMLELMRMFLKKGYFDAEDLAKIKGISFWDNKSFCFTGYRKPILDLDSIPAPDYSICSEECFTEKERWLWLGQPVRGIPYMTRRGCAYQCYFCQPSHFEGRVRKQSIKKTMKELMHIKKKYNVELIAFYDPIFAHNSEELNKFYGALSETGLLGDCFFYMQFFAKGFDEKMADILSRMLAYRIYFGFESGSEEVLSLLKNKKVSISDNIKVSRLAQKYSLRLDTCFMIGVPGETEEDLQTTERFIEEQYLNYVQVAHTVPQPGTPLWDYCIKEKLLPLSIDWNIMEPKPDISDEDLIYINPELDKGLYMEYNRRINRLAKQKTEIGKTLVSGRFKRDLAVIRRDANGTYDS